MPPNSLSDTHVNGLLTMVTIGIPDGSIFNAAVAANAVIAASKCQQHFSQVYAGPGTVATETVIIHTVRGATATVKGFSASQIDAPAGSSTATIDLRKNGVSVLTSVITLNAGAGDYGTLGATLDTTAAVADDVFTVVITAVQSGTDALATGVSAQLRIDEDYVV